VPPAVSGRGNEAEPFVMVRRVNTDDDAPREARDAAGKLVDHLGACARHRRGDLELVVSEMVSNAVLHGPAGEVEFKIVGTREKIRVEVSDHGCDPFTRPEGFSPGGHWGLGLVEEFSDRFGIERKPWTCVWCELDLKGFAASG
jgi:anti-sigma regulatory factor (Ser/Thr protein kinase)